MNCSCSRFQYVHYGFGGHHRHLGSGLEKKHGGALHAQLRELSCADHILDLRVPQQNQYYAHFAAAMPPCFLHALQVWNSGIDGCQGSGLMDV